MNQIAPIPICNYSLENCAESIRTSIQSHKVKIRELRANLRQIQKLSKKKVSLEKSIKDISGLNLDLSGPTTQQIDALDNL